jgi:hypothetical protein
MEMRVKERNRERKMSYFGDPATQVFSHEM